MERLTYTNINGDTIVFSQESVYKWFGVEGLGGLESMFQTDKTVFEDGETIINDGTFNSKVFVLNFNLISSSIYVHLRDLNRILNPRLGSGTLKYETGTGITRVFNEVRVRRMPSLSASSARRAGFQPSIITFNIFDPVYYDEFFSIRTLVTQQASFEFPLEIDSIMGIQFGTIFAQGFPIPNLGDLDTPVRLTLNGPLTSPIVIRNSTTSQEIVVETSIASDEFLEVNTDTRDIDVVRILADGTRQRAFNFLNVDLTDFWQLQPGENNIILTSGGTLLEDTIIRWKNKYVGI